MRNWNAHSQRLAASWRLKGQVRGVFFSPDLKLVAVASETMVTVWPRLGGTPLGVFRGNGSQARIRSFAFSPDSRIVACGYHDGTIRLWRVADGASTGVLRGDAEAIWSLAFDPTGSRLASGSFAGTVRL
jgi:WD40 repeat protein